MSASSATPEPLSMAEKTAILHRLRRAQGQVGGVIRMVEEDRDCREVVQQLTAARKALDRAGLAVISGTMRQCLLGRTAEDMARLTSLEDLFLRLT